MTSPWQDRRGLFQRGREVHEPSSPVDSARRASDASITEKVSRTLSNQSGGSTSKGTDPMPSVPSAGQRRRSSAASSAGMFGNLMNHKRGSEDYSTRRASHIEMEGKEGVLSGLWNKTFRGGGSTQEAKPAAGAGEQRRGVME